jgi:hypothetical protein
MSEVAKGISELCDLVATLRDEVARLEVENERLQEIVAKIPRALNDAFAAGAEEREGGSVLRQDKYMRSVDEVRSAALTIPDPAGGMPVEVKP